MINTKSEPQRPVDPYTEFRRALLPIERVRELSQPRPVRALADTIGCWLAIIGALAVVAHWPKWWVVLLAIPVIGTRYYALFIIGHDGLHRRLHPRVATNDLIADVFVFGAIGAVTRMNNRNHLNHHQHLASELDPDRHKHGCFNKTRPSELIGFLTGTSSLWRSVSNVFGRKRTATKVTSAVRYTIRDLSLLLAWQVALVGGMTRFIGFWAWPVLWLLPVYVFAFLGDNARAFLEHSHPENDAVADGHRLVTFTSNLLERTFFAPMHMNFHAAHHLWPSIPYYNLPIADREMRALPAAQAIEVRGSYTAYLWRYYRAMPLRQCREGVLAGSEA